MSSRKFAAVTAACAAGAALGLVGVSTPAVASGSANATYSCVYVAPDSGGTYQYPDITTVWQHGVSTNLAIKTSMQASSAIPVGVLSTMVNGVKVANAMPIATGDLIALGPANVPGPVSAPNPMILHYDLINIDITCSLLGSSGFPI